MMTILVPTDFSNVATNAARYAAQMITGHYDAHLILYHVYEKPAEAEEAQAILDKLKEELQSSSIARIEIRMDEGGDIIDCLERQARHLDVQLIVMGITGKSRLEKVFLGSNTLKMVERNICPVLIIPPSVRLQGCTGKHSFCSYKKCAGDLQPGPSYHQCEQRALCVTHPGIPGRAQPAAGYVPGAES